MNLVPSEVNIMGGLRPALGDRRHPRHDRNNAEGLSAQSPPAVSLLSLPRVRDASAGVDLHHDHRHFGDPEMTTEARQ